MCGIAGKLTWDPRGAIDADLLGAMTDAVRHRGPDADGFYFGEGVGLGHRRLSIIDLATGDQPLANVNPLLASFMLADLFNMDDASRQLFLQLRLTSERLKACQENLLRIEAGTDERITAQQFLKPFYSNKHK